MSRASSESAAPQPGDAEAELARWLVEVGRRRRPARPAAQGPVLMCSAEAPRRRGGLGFRRVLLVGVLAAAVFQYAYLDALLQVVSLRSLIVFVLAGAHG